MQPDPDQLKVISEILGQVVVIVMIKLSQEGLRAWQDHKQGRRRPRRCTPKRSAVAVRRRRTRQQRIRCTYRTSKIEKIEADRDAAK